MAFEKDQLNYNIKTFFELPIMWLKLIGMWKSNLYDVFPRPIKFIGTIIEYLYRFFIISNIIYLLFSLIFTTYLKSDEEFDVVFDLFLNSGVYLWIIICISFYAAQQKSFMEVFVIMNQQFRRRSAPGLTYITMGPAFKRARKLFNYWQWSCLVVGTSYALLPLLSEKRTLAIPVWYPFDAHVI